MLRSGRIAKINKPEARQLPNLGRLLPDEFYCFLSWPAALRLQIACEYDLTDADPLPRGEFHAPLTASEARANLYRLIDETATSHQPLLISGKRHGAVLRSAEDWASVRETLYQLSASGMRESIREGLSTPADACDKELGW